MKAEDMPWLGAVRVYMDHLRGISSDNQWRAICVQHIRHQLSGPFVRGVAALHDLEAEDVTMKDVALQCKQDLWELYGVGSVTMKHAAAVIKFHYYVPWYME